MDLSCSHGQMINLVRANYGRFSLSICNPSGQIDLSVNCMSYKSYLIMRDRCTQSSNCSIVVSSKTFDDPCPGTSKYLEVQYYCAHPTSITDNVAITGDDNSSNNNNTGANLGASTVTTAPVIVTTRKYASSNSDSDILTSPSSPSLPPDYGTGVISPPSTQSQLPLHHNNKAHTTVSTSSIKAPYETSSQQINNNSTSISANTSNNSSVISRSSSKGNNAVVTFKPNETPKLNLDGDHHHHSHPYHPVTPKITRPGGGSGSMFPTEIIGDKFNPRSRESSPSVPETSLPPWLENIDGDTNYRKTLDDLFKEKDSSAESSSSSSSSFDGNNNASPVANDDDDDGMMSMAIALFFIVFFLVLATFGLIYCILRSDHVRSRKLVSRIPFITCLFGPDISSDVEVEKVSSVVQSSAYGTTSGTSGPVSFPIIATRVPTQITSTSATGFESPSSSASSLNVKGAHCSLGVSSPSNQQQLTSPVRLIHVNSPASTGSAWNFPSSLSLPPFHLNLAFGPAPSLSLPISLHLAAISTRAS